MQFLIYFGFVLSLCAVGQAVQCFSCVAKEKAGKFCRRVSEAQIVSCPRSSTFCSALVFLKHGKVNVNRGCAGNVASWGFGATECDIMAAPSLLDVGVAFYQCRGDLCNNIEPAEEATVKKDGGVELLTQSSKENIVDENGSETSESSDEEESNYAPKKTTRRTSSTTEETEETEERTTATVTKRPATKSTARSQTPTYPEETAATPETTLYSRRPAYSTQKRSSEQTRIRTVATTRRATPSESEEESEKTRARTVASTKSKRPAYPSEEEEGGEEEETGGENHENLNEKTEEHTFRPPVVTPKKRVDYGQETELMSASVTQSFAKPSRRGRTIFDRR